MRKYLLILTMLLFIAACGNNETENEPVEADAEVAEDEVTEPEEEKNEELESFVEENDVQLDEDGFFVETTDPLEAGDNNNGIMVYDNDGELFIIKEWYTNDDTDEDGFNTIDFDGYEVKYAITLIENVEEEDMIGVFVETENNTEDEIQFNMDMEFVTDTQDQITTEDGIGESKPGVKKKGFNYAYLNYDAPKSFTVSIEPPFKAVGDNQYEEGHYGEPIELEFTKE